MASSLCFPKDTEQIKCNPKEKKKIIKKLASPRTTNETPLYHTAAPKFTWMECIFVYWTNHDSMLDFVATSTNTAVWLTYKHTITCTHKHSIQYHSYNKQFSSALTNLPQLQQFNFHAIFSRFLSLFFSFVELQIKWTKTSKQK